MLNGVSTRMPHNNDGLAKKLYSKFKQTFKPIQTKWKFWDHSSDRSSTSSSSTHSTLDWRSLSPDKPPLPFFLPNENYSPSSSTTDLLHQTILIPNTDTIETNKKYTKTRSTEDPNNFQPLCPIMEESETMITDTNSSIVTKSIQQQNEESSSSRVINSQSSAAADKPNTDSNSSDTTTFSAVSSRSVASSAVSPHPTTQKITPIHSLNEEECKRKFVKIVLATNKYRQKKDAKKPTKMSLSFDANDNIEMMCVIRQGKTEYHKFNGISQYIPPELFEDKEYHYSTVDVWVLGVHLYKMLLGQYPFAGTNDKQRFKNMQQGSFVFPDQLSTEAKDLLKHMLAPDETRAPLDVVIHHPWLKTYHSYLVKNCHIEKESQNKKTTKKQFPLKSVVNLLIQGPFPPPKRPYRDLVHLGTRESVFFAQF